MTSDRYLSTRAIQAAVERREAKVFEALGRAGVIAAFGARHWRWRLEVVE